MPAPIFVVGDPHGRWSRLHDACRKSPVVGHILLLGDCDLEEPLAQVLAVEIAAGWRVRWIIGNHDTDSVAAYDNLAGSLPGADLGNTWVSAGRLIIGGLGGTYRGKIWYPRYPDSDPPTYATRNDYMRQVRPTDKFRGGVPLPLRSAIWPSDHLVVSRYRLDVLLSHEAPATKQMGDKGFLGLTELLDANPTTRLCVHGHHHHHYVEDLVLPSGRMCRVVGLAKGDVWPLEMPP
jgi:Calcineurin-like phosphoesterase